MTNWHRWLALDGVSRPTGRAITGAANLGFLFIVMSGMYLWCPRVWTWLQFRQVLWFRGGVPGKARDFNWHNVIGIWSAVPLAIVVAGAVPISYPWASDLVYRLAGEAPPAAGAARESAQWFRRSRRHPGDRRAATARRRVTGTRRRRRGLDAAWARATAHVPDWRTISVRLGGAGEAPFAIHDRRRLRRPAAEARHAHGRSCLRRGREDGRPSTT